MKKVFRMISLLALGFFTVAIVPFPVTAAEFIMKISLPSPMGEWTQFNEPYAVLKSEIEKRWVYHFILLLMT